MRFVALALGTGANTVVAHPSSGVVVDKSGVVIFADECRNIVFRIDADGKLTTWIACKHRHELFRDGEGNRYGEHLEFLSESAGWRSSIWRRDAAGRVTDVYGPAAGFAPGLLLDGQGNRYQGNGNENPNGPTSTITRGTDQSIYFIEADAVCRITMEGVVTTPDRRSSRADSRTASSTSHTIRPAGRPRRARSRQSRRATSQSIPGLSWSSSFSGSKDGGQRFEIRHAVGRVKVE